MTGKDETNADAPTRSGRIALRQLLSSGRSCAGTATWHCSGNWSGSAGRDTPRTRPSVLESTAQP